MATKLFDVTNPSGPRGGPGIRTLLIGVVILIAILAGNPFKVVPAGHVGVKNFFGNVSSDVLAMDLEASLLWRLDPTKAAEIYKTVGTEYPRVVVEPQIRSALREITASYEAKALYSAQREKIATEIFQLF